MLRRSISREDKGGSRSGSLGRGRQWENSNSSEEPVVAFSRVLELFGPRKKSYSTGVHPSAYVASSLVWGRNVSVGPFSVIEGKCRCRETIARRDGAVLRWPRHQNWTKTFLYPQVILREDVQIGGILHHHPARLLEETDTDIFLRMDITNKIPQIGTVMVVEDFVDKSVPAAHIDRGTMERR